MQAVGSAAPVFAGAGGTVRVALRPGVRAGGPVRLAGALLCAAVLWAWAPRPLAWDVTRLAQAAARMGPAAVAAAQALRTALGEAARMDEAARARAVNDFFNQRVAYVDDQQAWGAHDHWASPLELLARAQGDCEDYAIAKYFSLVAAGTAAAKLRLVYVRVDQGSGVPPMPHMVLAYYPAPGAEPLILDNLVEQIRTASQRPDLQPVFSFNADGLWQGTQGDRAGDPSARLSRWRDVLAKAAAEGFR